jgi:hypothetical protein
MSGHPCIDPTPAALESIRADTLALSLPGGRRVGTPGHDEAILIIESRMARIGLVPFRGEEFRLSYTGRDPIVGPEMRLTNLVGVLPGRDPSASPLLLGAHFDSFLAAPSTDDNAASVAVLLAAAEQMSTSGPSRDILFAFFDAEESPFFGTALMGSEQFLQEQAGERRPACAVILDMVGHPAETGLRGSDLLLPASGELLFVTGAESSPELPAALETAAGRVSGLRIVPTLNRYVGDTSDHRAFRSAGIPFLFISSGPGKCCHTTRDTPDCVSFPRLGRVLGIVLSLSFLLDGVAIRPAGDSPRDTSAFESRMLRKAVGWPLPLLLRLLGLPGRLRCRADLDALSERLGPTVRARTRRRGEG